MLWCKKETGEFVTSWAFLKGRLSIYRIHKEPRSWGIVFVQDLNCPPAPQPQPEPEDDLRLLAPLVTILEKVEAKHGSW